MKKVITLVAGIAIMFGTSTIVFADAPTNANNIDSQVNSQNNTKMNSQGNIQAGNTLTLSLDDCLNNIEKVNPSIKIEDSKIKVLDTQYNYDKTRSMAPDSDDAGSLDYYMQERYNWKKSLNDLNNEKHSRDEKLKSLKNDLKKQYLSAIADQRDIESIQTEMTNLDKNIEKTSLKVKLGQLKDTELDTLQSQRSQLQSRLNSTQAQLEAELLTIKQYLNIDLSKSIRLVPASKEFVKFDETGMQYRIENAVKRNYDLQAEANSIDLMKTQSGLYMTFNAANSVETVRGFDINISQAQDKLAQDKLSTQINIMKSYYDLKNKEDSVEAEKLNLEVAQNNFDTTEAKFNSGLVDGVDREVAKITLEEQKTKLQRAINDYMVAAESFKNLLQE